MYRDGTKKILTDIMSGEPHPDLQKGMEHEHCEMFGSDEPFQTTNYGVTTTPRKEYEITTGNRVCPVEDKLDKKNRSVRIIRGIEELKQQKSVDKAALEDAEIVAVVRD